MSFEGGKAEEGKRKLNKFELFWTDRYDWLLEHGYRLRARYKPGWTPSPNMTYFNSEDSRGRPRANVMDAIRVSDSRQVIIKYISKTRSPRELDNTTFFSLESVASHPDNACIPVLEVLTVPEDPDVVLLVFPLLRFFNSPNFESYSEALHCIRQLLAGLQFMHSHRMAHLDCQYLNVMMDARGLYPRGFHPCDDSVEPDFKTAAKARPRTLYPPRYYLIDFGESHKFPAEETAPRVNTGSFRAGDRSVPEFLLGDVPIDPFPVDVFTMGNIIRRVFVEGERGERRWSGYHHFEFLKPLVDKMMSEKPEDRPSMDEVVMEFDIVVKRLPSWKLRSKIYSKRDLRILGIYREPIHWIRTVYYMSRGVPAFPSEPYTRRD